MANYPTSGDDVISVERDNQTVDGLGGDDHIRGFANFLRLLGNAGDDWLAVDRWFSAAAAGVFVGTTRLEGGAGADQLDVALRFENTNQTDPAETTADLSATLLGGTGDDQLSLTMAANAGDQSATLSGGDGNDLIVASLASLTPSGQRDSAQALSALGGAGNDIIRLRADSGDSFYDTFAATLSAQGGSGADTLVATSFGSILLDPVSNVTLDGGSGADTLRATVELRSEYSAIANVHLLGGTGDDRLEARTLAHGNTPDAENRLEGGDGADTLKAVMALLTPDFLSQSGTVENLLYGGAGDDTLVATIENGLATGVWRSVVDGGYGDDTLRVVGGQDNVLRGGPGMDQMWGGAGTDRFVFLAPGDSTGAARDTIHGFAEGDRIGVSAIDAGVAGGDQAFVFTGTSGAAGDLWVVERGADAVVIAKTETGARLVARVAGAADHAWDAGDFLL